MKNYQILPQFGDGLSWLYVDCCRLEQDDQSIAILDESGNTQIPVSALAVLLVGPGSTMTHSALKVLSENGCTVVWTGQDGVRTYSASTGETRHSRLLLRQAWLATRDEPRLAVVARMYRYRFAEGLDEGLTLNQIRGKEGARVRDAYSRLAREFGVQWAGREYKQGNWDYADPLNRALSAANACLYGLCHAACLSLGYSPAIGFIHTGKQLSFIYDLADLYKTEISVPAAFSETAEGTADLERRVRMRMRVVMHEHKLMSRIPKDISWVMDVPHRERGDDPFADAPAQPNYLWEPAQGADVPLPHAPDPPGGAR